MRYFHVAEMAYFNDTNIPQKNNNQAFRRIPEYLNESDFSLLLFSSWILHAKMLFDT